MSPVFWYGFAAGCGAVVLGSLVFVLWFWMMSKVMARVPEVVASTLEMAGASVLHEQGDEKAGRWVNRPTRTVTGEQAERLLRELESGVQKGTDKLRTPQIDPEVLELIKKHQPVEPKDPSERLTLSGQENP